MPIECFVRSGNGEDDSRCRVAGELRAGRSIGHTMTAGTTGDRRPPEPEIAVNAMAIAAVSLDDTVAGLPVTIPVYATPTMGSGATARAAVTV